MKDKNECIKIAKKISEKTNKSIVKIIFDIIKSSIKYDANYKEYEYLEFYNLTDQEKSTYLTDKKNEEIIKKYNNSEDLLRLTDKGEIYKLFKEYLAREFLDLRDASYKDFKEFIERRDKIVCKTVKSVNGKVELIEIDKEKLKNEYNILKLYNSIMKKEEYLIEDYIVQDEELASLYSGSVNTIRITTFIKETGEVVILDRILRIGKNTYTDNFEKGALFALLDENGKVSSLAVDNKNHTYREHPKSFKTIKDFKVPEFKKCELLAKKLAKKVPSIRYASWDIAITKEAIILIKLEVNPQIYQLKPSVSNSKKGLLEKYREYINI